MEVTKTTSRIYILKAKLHTIFQEHVYKSNVLGIAPFFALTCLTNITSKSIWTIACISIFCSNTRSSVQTWITATFIQVCKSVINVTDIGKKINRLITYSFFNLNFWLGPSKYHQAEKKILIWKTQKVNNFIICFKRGQEEEYIMLSNGYRHTKLTFSSSPPICTFTDESIFIIFTASSILTWSTGAFIQVWKHVKFTYNCGIDKAYSWTATTLYTW